VRVACASWRRIALGVELGIGNVKGEVMAFERTVVVEQERQPFVDAHRCEMPVRPIETQAENLCEEARRRGLVMCRHGRVTDVTEL
jgi:hypothetical protein